MDIRENVPLAPFTTLWLGGPARYLAECAGEDEVRETLAFAATRGLPVFVLGGGSNVVVPDDGFPGLVLRMAVTGLEWREAGGAVEVAAGAGVEWDVLAADAVARGLGGVECLSGIPGTVGGTPIQNVGAYGQEVAEILVEVSCVDRASLERVSFPAAECGFRYRTSRFKREDAGRFVLLGATFRLVRGARPALRYTELAGAVEAAGGLAGMEPAAALSRVRETVLAIRRAKGMVLDDADPDSRSAGSFFTNPVLERGEFERLAREWLTAGGGEVPSFSDERGVKVPAAWLVEQAGFPRGTRRGGAAVSSKHSLALVNRGGTTADLLALAGEIERAVLERFGVRLEREPVVVGGAPVN